MEFGKLTFVRPTNEHTTEGLAPTTPAATQAPRAANVLDGQGRSMGQIDLHGYDFNFQHLPYSCLVERMRAQIQSKDLRNSEVISRIVEQFPDILDGKVRIIEDAVVFVVDCVHSTELVAFLEHANRSSLEHFNGILSGITGPIKQYGGYPIGFHGDSVHALFLGQTAIQHAQLTAHQLINSWVANSDPLTPAIRIGVAKGRVEIGLLGAEGDRRIEPMGCSVNEAFHAANGSGRAVYAHPRVRVILGESLQHNQSRIAA